MGRGSGGVQDRGIGRLHVRGGETAAVAEAAPFLATPVVHPSRAQHALDRGRGLRRAVGDGHLAGVGVERDAAAAVERVDCFIEVVQVKDYKADLVFSELKTFFERAAEYITDYPDVQIVLASYGKLGPELQECIGADEATLKKKKKMKKRFRCLRKN